MINATYSPDDNKLRLYAESRLDAETYARVKACGFIWAPKQDLFVAPKWTPDREDLLIELCGEIGDEDTSLCERAEERSERFEEYSDHRAEDAERARQAVSAITDGIPLGQPILVGHHSEKHARRDAEKIENGMRRSIKMWETSKYWKARAAGALRHAKYKELPRVRANRIKTLESDRRREQRTIADAERLLSLWAQLDNPYLGEEIRPGVRSEVDRRPCDDALRLTRATQIANYDHISTPATPEQPYGSSLWSALADGKITPQAGRDLAVASHERSIARAARWITHLDNRIEYERAMLDEQGATQLLARKPKSAAAQLPLVNYRAPGGIDCENMYHRGEMIHYPQVEMTAKEYAAINKDYKGTRVVTHSHRVRTCMQRHALVCVFLTDSKVHEIPEARQAPDRKPLPRPVVGTARSTVENIEPQAEIFDAMRDALRRGVQVVAADQLFPTPPDVARRVIELAEIRPGMHILEPSAGTGRLLDELPNGVTVVAVEINGNLIKALLPKFRPEVVTVHHVDFLTCREDLGPFDRIVMNPPFKNADDIKHIQHARRMLAPGGRLVAVCANGPRQRAALQGDAETWIDLPAGSFEESGTGVNAAIVVLTA